MQVMDCPRTGASVVFACESPFCDGKGPRAWDFGERAQEQRVTDVIEQDNRADSDNSRGNSERHYFDDTKKLIGRQNYPGLDVGV